MNSSILKKMVEVFIVYDFLYDIMNNIENI